MWVLSCLPHMHLLAGPMSLDDQGLAREVTYDQAMEDWGLGIEGFAVAARCMPQNCSMGVAFGPVH